MELSEALREWRDCMQMTQPEAADKLGVGLRTYKGWELGENAPHEKILRLALQALNHKLKAWD